MMIDLSLDYHAHILPCCDHGSDGLATSLRQLELAASAGVRTICATPHFYPQNESLGSFLERREEAYDLLRPKLGDEHPRVLLGAEVLICDGMERLEGLCKLCRDGTNELLLELPFYKWQDSIIDTVIALNDREDIKPIIAHADRYPTEDIERLIGEGISLQLNVSALSHMKHRRLYLGWINEGFVKYIGSDIHMLGTGYKDWEKAVKILKKRSS